MNMHIIDWSILIVVFGIIGVIGFQTKQYSHSVSDFLAASRCGRRYLLTIAAGMASLGAISIVAYFEQYYQSGFVSIWWGLMLMPINMFISLSGWVVYRFRQTRAMTMAQFFEIRYSKKFRVFSGIVAWVSGIVNFGVFPAVGARLLIYLTGLPIYTAHLGPLELDLTLGVVMIFMLSIAVFMTLAGGQITIMVTEFLQGQFTNVVFVILLIFVFATIGWSDIINGIKDMPAGKSMVNPFAAGDIPDFNFWYFAILSFGSFYGCMAWQGGQGFNCSAKTPHEARMAKVLSSFSGGVTGLVILLLPIVLFAIQHNPKYAVQTVSINEAIARVPDAQIQKQMTTPIGLVHILPAGLLGLFVAVGFAAATSVSQTYLHSWGSIFIQDVILPFRKIPFGPQHHIKLLRWSIVGVAVFSWFFSMLFPLKEYIFMFFQITGAIFVGGAGAAIIGGLYWKRGTTAGAWTGMITGSVLAFGSIVLTNILWPYFLPMLKEAWPDWQLMQNLPNQFPINGTWLGFISSIIAVTVYVVVSLLSGQPAFNMDRLLHRGEYAIKDEHTVESNKKVSRLSQMFGMGKEFSRTDRVIYILTLCWSGFWFITFLAGTAYCVIVKPFSDEVWIKWWWVFCALTGGVGIITAVWFLWGGFIDLGKLFHELRTIKRNDLDNGTVVNHHNLSEQTDTSSTADDQKTL
ncbi:MAG TPA: sodium:solute symporter [Phycisphaerales bacterium]|nr:MAG: hypothetical protein A2Y13_03450 [Planctomycetes bacterium GWC2_45_44]HBG78157.1 sodium:solute symporter [Phycisphaerales bacterium]HBR19047.1 sodium:solute symporter [Phycisphaerales bacterium]